MQHIIQEWKEKKRGEFLKKVEKSDFSYDDWNKEISDWWLSQLPSLITLLEEQMPKEKDITLNEIGTCGDYHTHGYNEYHDAVRTLLAEAKKQLTK